MAKDDNSTSTDILPHILNFQRRELKSKDIDYKFEEERIKSFSSWQVHFPVDPVRLAKAGFYYTGNEDEVICFSCYGHIKNWNYGDVVIKKHTELFPNCDFVNKRSNNVPVAQAKRSSKSLEKNKGTDVISEKLTKFSPLSSSLPHPEKDEFSRMKSFQERVNSFMPHWPLSYIDVTKMAQAGFFYLGHEDKVQCPFCKGIVSNWEATDDPWQEHAKHFPWCDHISGITLQKCPTDKVPWYQTNSQDTCGNMEKQEEYTLKCRLLDESQEHLRLKKLGVHLHKGPAHPHQSSLSARLRSFVPWPHTSPVSKEDLAKAGFFYIGIKDHTKCFHCDGGLCNWERNDDPWVEHAKWFSDCGFVRLTKGEAFIKSCQIKAERSRQTLSCTWSEPLMIKVDEAMKSDIVNCVLETELFPSYIIRAAILRQIKETGSSFSSEDDLCCAISFLKAEMENEPLKMNNYQAADLNIQETDFRKCTIGEGTDGEAKIMNSEHQTGSSNSKLPDIQNNFSKDQCLCKICMDQEVGVVFLPCGHLLTCIECAPALKLCPMCRKTIQATVRAYLP